MKYTCTIFFETSLHKSKGFLLKKHVKYLLHPWNTKYLLYIVHTSYFSNSFCGLGNRSSTVFHSIIMNFIQSGMPQLNSSGMISVCKCRYNFLATFSSLNWAIVFLFQFAKATRKQDGSYSDYHRNDFNRSPSQGRNNFLSLVEIRVLKLL